MVLCRRGLSCALYGVRQPPHPTLTIRLVSRCCRPAWLRATALESAQGALGGVPSQLPPHGLGPSSGCEGDSPPRNPLVPSRLRPLLSQTADSGSIKGRRTLVLHWVWALGLECRHRTLRRPLPRPPRPGTNSLILTLPTCDRTRGQSLQGSGFCSEPFGTKKRHPRRGECISSTSSASGLKGRSLREPVSLTGARGPRGPLCAGSCHTGTSSTHRILAALEGAL